MVLGERGEMRQSLFWGGLNIMGSETGLTVKRTKVADLLAAAASG